MKTKFTLLLLLDLLVASITYEQNKVPVNSAWLLKGNANTDTAINFIGTKDSVPLIIKVAGQTSGYLGFSHPGNTSFGYQALRYHLSAHNTAFGYQALMKNSGDNNTAMGYHALYLNTTGIYNTAVGSRALFHNTEGFSNTAIGFQTLYENVGGHDNIAIGQGALTDNVNGRYNTAIGTDALFQNAADNNMAVGFYALQYNTQGLYNTAIGNSSLELNTTGSGNTATGLNTLIYNTTGNNNTAYGYGTLNSNYTGSYNTAIGSGANVSGRNHNNSTAIGCGAAADGSNIIRAGNASVVSIGGQVEWTSLSDERAKENIVENVPGLIFINKLRPVTYHINITKENQLRGVPDSTTWDEKKDIEKIQFTGLLAQDVDETAKSIGYDFSGVDKSGKLMGLRYGTFVAPLIKAVQELSKMNLEKDSAIENLRLQMNDLKTEVDNLKAVIISNSAGNTQNINTITSVSLQQNIPNPFSGLTVISYTLPSAYTSANITVTDMRGCIVKIYNLSGNGEGRISFEPNTIKGGSYRYSLYINGKLIDTKQMIMSK
jgi:hypothetical protein